MSTGISHSSSFTTTPVSFLLADVVTRPFYYFVKPDMSGLLGLIVMLENSVRVIPFPYVLHYKQVPRPEVICTEYE